MNSIGFTLFGSVGTVKRVASIVVTLHAHQPEWDNVNVDNLLQIPIRFIQFIEHKIGRLLIQSRVVEL